MFVFATDVPTRRTAMRGAFSSSYNIFGDDNGVPVSDVIDLCSSRENDPSSSHSSMHVSVSAVLLFNVHFL